MNVVFLTLARITNVEERSIYHDLMRRFRNENHTVYIATAAERRFGKETSLVDDYGVKILNVKTLNVQKTNIVEKGIGTLLIERQFKAAIKKYLGGVKFDLITYSTPPITFTNVVKYLKKENPGALSYLQLKDIFPQNAVDIGMMSTTGVKGLLYKFFRRKEKKLYALSDYIGCMSPANVSYVIRHNPEVAPSKVEVAPNSVELCHTDNTDGTDYNAIRNRYGLPIDKPVFIYGGNLGKPQGIPFLMKCLEANTKRSDCHFVVIGTGTELPKLQAWYRSLRSKSEESYSENLSTSKDSENSKLSTLNSQLSITVMEGLPKAEYDELVRACDVGLIFLDHRFTIPNYPSRLLSYLENKMPVLCATDPNTDMGRIAEANGYGYWCESNSVEAFTAILDKMIHSNRKAMGEKGYEFLKANYLVENTYNTIMRHF